MMVAPKITHTKLGYIPEIHQYLVRDNSTNNLELWTRSRGVAMQVIYIDTVELEFVREAQRAYRVPDSDYNRKHRPHEIGRIYIDDRPFGVDLQEIR